MTDLLKTIHRILDEKKAMDIRILDVSKVSTFTNFFVVCSGGNDRHVQTLADALERELRTEKGIRPSHVEGTQAAQWVLMDYFDFIVHIFSLEAREYYELERFWSDAPRVEPEA